MVGEPKSLRVDCWGEVDEADGYDVTLTSEDSTNDGPELKLFSHNLGGYAPEEFSELNRNILLVASDAKAATKRAIQEIGSGTLPHKHNVFEVEKAVDVTDMASSYAYRLKLTEAEIEQPFQFTCAYIRIGL